MMDLTQRQLAEAAGCATITVRKLEKGDLRPSEQLARSIAGVCGVEPGDVDDFVGFARGAESTARLEATPWRAATDHRPSIAVAPFANLGDPDLAGLATGIAGHLQVALTEAHWITVTSPDWLDDEAHRARLGVDYLLEGNVRTVPGAPVLAIQLTRLGDGHVLWAHEYTVADGATVAEATAEAVTRAIEPRLLEEEVHLSQARAPEELTAFDLYLQALPLLHSSSADVRTEALQRLDRSIAAEENASALGAASWLCTVMHLARPYSGADTLIERGLDYAYRATAADRFDPVALASAGYAIAFLGEDFGYGSLLLDQAHELHPSHPATWAHRGWISLYAGTAGDAIASFEQFLHLSPLDPMVCRAHAGLAYAYLFECRPDDALPWAQRAALGGGRGAPMLRALAISLAGCGRMAEARSVANEMLDLYPDDIERYRAWTRFRHVPRHLESVVQGLRAVGVPEGRPSE